MSDDLSTLRANQAVLAARIAALESRLSAADGVVDAVVYCGAEKPDYGAPHPCGLPDGHEGPHSCLHAYCTVTWPDPEPVPEWRRLADAGVRNLTNEDPLAVVLRSLANISDPSKVTTANLARIVAVAEGQYGDGWQADPDEWPMTPNLTTLLVYLTDSGYGEPRWANLANAAAAWLRDLTQDGAQ